MANPYNDPLLRLNFTPTYPYNGEKFKSTGIPPNYYVLFDTSKPGTDSKTVDQYADYINKVIVSGYIGRANLITLYSHGYYLFILDDKDPLYNGEPLQFEASGRPMPRRPGHGGTPPPPPVSPSGVL